MSQTSLELEVLPPTSAKESSDDILLSAASVAEQTTFDEIITSKSRTLLIILSTTLVTAIGSLLSGMITVSLPHLITDLDIPEGLQLWPISIRALTCGCTLLLFGSLSDVLGSRSMYLLGSVLQAAFTLGCGLCRNAGELIIFSGLCGISMSMCLPSSVSILTGSFTGRTRNLAIAAMGGGQPVGFALGLTMGGVLSDTVGWRVGMYIVAAVNALVFLVGLYAVPNTNATATPRTWNEKWNQIAYDIDWVGAVLASSSLAMFSYVFAILSGDTADIKHPASISLLAVATALIPAFIVWEGRQELLRRPAIIPNSLWRNQTFTTICLSVFMTWGSFNAIETLLTFYFQDVQQLSATETSIRFLPAPVSGVAANIAIGLLVSRVNANILVIVGCAITCFTPLPMIFAGPKSNYWATGFIANLLNPIGADTLYTISTLLITSVFPEKTQGLAGGVFNTISQIGKSVGLVAISVIASSVTRQSKYEDKSSPKALMDGYRAGFWFCLGLGALTLAVSTWGLRRIGKVGHKQE